MFTEFSQARLIRDCWIIRKHPSRLQGSWSWQTRNYSQILSSQNNFPEYRWAGTGKQGTTVGTSKQEMSLQGAGEPQTWNMTAGVFTKLTGDLSLKVPMWLDKKPSKDCHWSQREWVPLDVSHMCHWQLALGANSSIWSHIRTREGSPFFPLRSSSALYWQIWILYLLQKIHA